MTEFRGVAETYQGLHDGMSEIIEGGRLDETDLPDDYVWLVESLAYLARHPNGVRIGNDVVFDHWTEQAEHPVADWQYEVSNGDTRLGYLDWCRHRHESWVEGGVIPETDDPFGEPIGEDRPEVEETDIEVGGDVITEESV